MIPAIAHFFWRGRSFPYVNVLALYSCAKNGGFDEIFLHCSDDPDSWEYAGELSRIKNLKIMHGDYIAVLQSLGNGRKTLHDLYQQLASPVARSNIIRTAVLQHWGGVYLDFDTVTIAPLDDLRKMFPVFFGLERIALPYHIRISRNPLVKVAAFIRKTVRSYCRWRKNGWRLFRSCERWYPLAENCAVLGATHGHPLLGEMIKAMLAVPEEQVGKKHILGTNLLQRVACASTDARIGRLDPEYFYPVPPEISVHWFREDTAARVDDLLLPGTCIVHWYASVRTKEIIPLLTPDFIRHHADRMPFCALATRYAGGGGASGT